MVRIAAQAIESKLPFVITICTGQGCSAQLKFDENPAAEVAPADVQLANDTAYA
jgi:hypothetical protein